MSKPTPEQSPQPEADSRCRRRGVFTRGILCGIVVLAGWGLYLGALPDPTQPSGGPAPAAAEQDAAPVKAGPSEGPSAAPTPTDPDARFRQLAVGTWQDDYQGKRTMTLREDGTGTMLVELSGMRAMFASRLRFDMQWSVQAGRLKKRTIGGEPAGKVALILKTMGDRVDEPILELTADRMLVLDQDGQTRYDWRRVR